MPERKITMGNQFTDYLGMLNSYSKSDIQWQLLCSFLISLFYLLILKFILKKLAIEKNIKQHISCGFLVSLIYNIVTPYFAFSIFPGLLTNLIINSIFKMIVIVILIFVESIILELIIPDKKFKRKILIWQGISIPLFTLVSNMIILFLLVIVSSFM